MTRRTLLIVLVCLSVAFAGCAGWGTDGPADGDVESEGSDDPEETNDGSEGDGATNGNGSDDDDGTDEGEVNDGGSEPGSTGSESAASENDSSVDDESNGGTDDATGETEDDGPSTADSDDGSPAVDDESAGEDERDAPAGDENSESATNDATGDEPGTYTYSVTIEVVDGDGDPVEGRTVTEDHEAIEPVDHRTDENGEVTIEFENSMPDDAVERQITVDDETQTVWIEAGEQSIEFVVDDVEGDDGNGTDEGTAALVVR